MTSNKPNIFQRSLALIVLVVVALPTLVSFAHVIDGHKHSDGCTITDTHVHESKIDCDLNDMQIVDHSFYAFAKAYILPSPTFQQTKFVFSTSNYTKIVESISNRGPPQSC